MYRTRGGYKPVFPEVCYFPGTASVTSDSKKLQLPLREELIFTKAVRYYGLQKRGHQRLRELWRDISDYSCWAQLFFAPFIVLVVA